MTETLTFSYVGLDQLAAFVTDHGFRTEVRDGVLYGEMAFSSSAGLAYEWEPIGSTVRETRVWLGY